MYFCAMKVIESKNANLRIMESLEYIINEIILKMTQSSGEIDTMSFDNLLKTVQTLTRTVQNFIKIIEITSKTSEAGEEESKFIEKIIENPEALDLANKLLEKLESNFKF
jgi:hypothetical protein